MSENVPEKKRLTGDKHQEITTLLHVYNTWSTRQHEAENTSRGAYEKLQEAIAPESRSFSCRVRKVMKNARKEWTLDKAGLSVVIQHNHRPLQYWISADIHLYFYDADWRRGEMRLSGSIDKIEDILEELKAAVCGKIGGAK